MKVVCNKRALPRVWARAYDKEKTLLLEKDIRFNSLYLKLLVFPSRKAFHNFWDRCHPTAVGGKIGSALGAVGSMQCESRSFKKGRSIMGVDRRYFAVMGLVRGCLGMEIVTHESVHAAYSYAKRVGPRNPWAPVVGTDGLDEELVCYPAGRIARLVVNALNEAGMYKNNRIGTGGI
jgi:hypothetical protein